MLLQIIFGFSLALTVSHYDRCTGPKGPKDISELEKKIDEIVNTAQWLLDVKGR